MDDDEIVFQDSVLHKHLQSIGYTDEDVSVEYKARDRDWESDQSTSEQSNQNRSGTAKITFWTKLTNSVGSAFWDDAWNDQLTQVHNKHADELTDNILQSAVLEEEDGNYIASFYTSMQSYRPDAEQGESSIMGVMLMQMAILSVSLAYAGFRMIYLKSPDMTSRYYVWSIDVIAVLLTIASLTPTTVKSASAGRAVSRLKEFTQTSRNFLKEVDIFYRLTKKSVKLIQEMELVARGFTIITPETPMTRLEQGSLPSSCRQCPKLRRLIFHSSRSLMLNIKRSAQNLLKGFPAHVEIDGIASYLANQPLHHYGPCVYVRGDHEEDRLRAVTEDYSLAAIKAMVELCNIHMSEFLRILAMSCLTQSEEHDKNPSYKQQKQIVEKLLTKIHEHIKPLTKLYTLHKTLVSARERKEKERQQPRRPTRQTPAESLYITVHSLSLHLQAALNRVQRVEDELEPLASITEESSKSESTDLSSELLHSVVSSLGHIRTDVSACQDCVEESQIRVGKLSPNVDKHGSDAAESTSQAESTDGKEKPAPIPLFDIGDPIIQDQVFEAYTDDVDAEISQGDGDFLLSDEEREKRRREKREAVRLLKELKTVIAVRAVEYEERERQALLRQYPDSGFQDPISSLRSQTGGSGVAQSEVSQVGATRSEGPQSGATRSEGPQPEPQEQSEDTESGNGANGKESDFVDVSRGECLYEEAGVDNVSSERLEDESHGPISFEGDTSASLEPCSPSPLSQHPDVDFKQSLLQGTSVGFPFSKHLAAQAVARSHQMAALSEDTFGDGSSEDECCYRDEDQQLDGSGKLESDRTAPEQ